MLLPPFTELEVVHASKVCVPTIARGVHQETIWADGRPYPASYQRFGPDVVHLRQLPPRTDQRVVQDKNAISEVLKDSWIEKHAAPPSPPAADATAADVAAAEAALHL